MSIRIGTQGWNYTAWVGPFYPEGTKPLEFLRTYAQAFSTVEVDSTFYAIPPAKSVRGWAQRTPDGFLFALKMPQEVTHERRLRDAEAATDEFLDRARELGPKLGPVLVQMGPDFGPDEFAALERFVERLPRDVRFAVEVRQSRWMADAVLPRLLSLLESHGAALALSDGKWIPRETMTELAAAPTADFHYIRWMGPNRDIVEYSHLQFDRSGEIRSWAEVLKTIAGRGVSVFGYFNNHFAGHSPANARELQSLLGQTPVEPKAIGEQISLF
ncbi:MAG: FIG003003: hypothetical protein [uncultured Gemmatimonadetes bacterium]|uniref:DUF72 domain-containing protein n=1 Tax=uncultured Gemmatimonadota bacterium TaxID=203437 RepID=A0A6J4LMB7_9BACT|nr:MAG: FIG003003: hypothetical protein [uncultured Gemmatimonadota bacterium]